MPLYVVKRRSLGKLVDHSGVLVVGNLLELLSAKELFQDRRPLGVIVHSTPPGGVQHEVVYSPQVRGITTVAAALLWGLGGSGGAGAGSER